MAEQTEGKKTLWGRPPKFKTPEDMYVQFQSWKGEFDKDGLFEGEIPDVEGFLDYIDSYRELFYEYEKKEDFSQTVKRIKNWIYYRKKQLAMANKMNAAIFIFDAKNNAGYNDRTEQDLTTDGQAFNFTIGRGNSD